ncbi:MAG TPA: TraM recognition domain-containing protein [Streptosporangiaceae bacterium]|nr:TraM recognition domain-containing protein [Streptosporangiaceae bacterium]
MISGLLSFVLGLAAGLVRLASHDPIAFLVLAAVFAAPVLFWRQVLGGRAQGRRRARALKWRIRLRLRPGAGFASLAEVVFRWGRLAAVHHGKRIRPGLGWWARVFSPVTGYAVRLGRAQYFRRVFARGEDQTLIIAPPRTGKSGIIADRLLSHAGPAIVTSTRADLYQLTAGARSRCGPVYVFNPQGVGGIPSTFGFDLLGPCRDLVMARRMAGWLTGAATGADSNLGNLEWFSQAADSAMMACLFAAATGGYTITDVYGWTQLQGHEDALRVLAGRPGCELLVATLKRAFESNRTAGSIRESMALSLAWATVPQLAAAATPREGEGFDLREFILLNGTLYLVAPGDEDSPVAPLFAAFTTWITVAAGQLGSLTRAGKLDPPLWLGLDEVTQICPVPLPLMLADSAGKGVLITAVAHGVSQLADRWGENGAKTVWATCGTKIILGGVSDADTLKEISDLCGTVAAGDGDKLLPVVPPELVRGLPDWRALCLRMNLNPVVVKVRPGWKRLGCRFGRRVPVCIPRPRYPDYLEREPTPAEVMPALSDADYHRLLGEPEPDTFPLPAGPDPAAFRNRRPS